MTVAMALGVSRKGRKVVEAERKSNRAVASLTSDDSFTIGRVVGNSVWGLEGDRRRRAVNLLVMVSCM